MQNLTAEVLIVGAGPTGLALALWLTKQAIKVRIIDKAADHNKTSRALAIQARTLELYQQLGLTDELLQLGNINPQFNLWVNGQCQASLSLEASGQNLTAYPYVLIYPQDKHEALLRQRLADLGVEVEVDTELLSFSQDDQQVLATLKHADGTTSTSSYAYLAGCDGAHSTVRHGIQSSFSGSTYENMFYVADIEGSSELAKPGININITAADFVASFAFKQPQQLRLVGITRVPDNNTKLNFTDISQQAIQSLKLNISQVKWFSTYHVHHRVADKFQQGRAFLLGDAAHIHSPVGGQGMNTGIGDAINLAWKLSQVLKGKASAKLLDSYSLERRAFAVKLVKTTDKLFTLITSTSKLANFVRQHVFAHVAKILLSYRKIRRFMFNTVSQLHVNYRHSWLSQGMSQQLAAGDRLPWLASINNYASLTLIDWQIHCYGTAPLLLVDWCKANAVPLRQFAWQADFAQQGLQADTLYLLRPDTYIALIANHQDTAKLDHYFALLKP